jgi:hypothetical protein
LNKDRDPEDEAATRRRKVREKAAKLRDPESVELMNVVMWQLSLR